MAFAATAGLRLLVGLRPGAEAFAVAAGAISEAVVVCAALVFRGPLVGAADFLAIAFLATGFLVVERFVDAFLAVERFVEAFLADDCFGAAFFGEGRLVDAALTAFFGATPLDVAFPVPAAVAPFLPAVSLAALLLLAVRDRLTGLRPAGFLVDCRLVVLDRAARPARLDVVVPILGTIGISRALP